MILVQGVASFPGRTDEVKWDDPHLQKWLKLTIQFLSSKYGDQLKSVVVHSDEPYWHCHFSLVPDLEENNRLDIGKVHDGIAARNKVSSKCAKDKLRAYTDAMRAFQDEYHAAVGIQCGLTRDGPSRRRLTRKQWKLEKAASTRLSRTLNICNLTQRKVELANEALNKKKNNIDSLQIQLIKLLKDLKTPESILRKILLKLNNFNKEYPER